MAANSLSMADLSAKENPMSSTTQDFGQHQTIESKQKRAGNHSGKPPANKSPSSRPDLVGLQFGSVMVISPDVVWIGKKWSRKLHVHCMCMTCGKKSTLSYDNLKGRRTKGCRACNQPRRFPKWLYQRAVGMHQRCTNPKHSMYERYGGRGIKFMFQSASDAAAWIQDNLGLPAEPKKFQIDRINNDGHYEPGNLRWATQTQNMSHTTRSKHSARFHAFRMAYPAVKYADLTLRHLLSLGLTDDQIVLRWNTPSYKPKGKYGTFSTADPVIASQSKDS